jgi:hypothetical protein
MDRLPPMLDELEPTAASLASLSREARPVLGDLREAAPGVRALAADLDPLNDAARPALVRLADMSKTGRSAVRAATPVAGLLKPVADKLPAVVADTAALVESMRTRGVVEGLQGVKYFASLAPSRFDRYSHILPSYQVGGTCNQAATKPAPGCDAHFAGSTENPGSANDKRTARKHRRHRRKADRGRRTAEAGGRRTAGGDRGSSNAPAVPPSANNPPSAVPPSANPPAAPADPVENVLDFLLGP